MTLKLDCFKALKLLKKNDDSLTSLDISNNEIADEGAKAISKALNVNYYLTSLYIHDNEIEEEYAKAFK